MADDGGAGFTVKEMLVRVETKMDIVLADHEARLRKIENSDALNEGADGNKDKISAKLLAWAILGVSVIGGIEQVFYHYLTLH